MKIRPLLALEKFTCLQHACSIFTMLWANSQIWIPARTGGLALVNYIFTLISDCGTAWNIFGIRRTLSLRELSTNLSQFERMSSPMYFIGVHIYALCISSVKSFKDFLNFELAHRQCIIKGPHAIQGTIWVFVCPKLSRDLAESCAPKVHNSNCHAECNTYSNHQPCCQNSF